MAEKTRERIPFPEAFARFLNERIGYGQRYETQRDMAKAAQVPQSHVSRLKKGETKKPNPYVLQRISHTLGERPTYLTELWSYCQSIAEYHPDEVTSVKPVGEEDPVYDHVHARKIPVFPADCGVIIDWKDGGHQAAKRQEYSLTDSSDPNAFYVRAEGESVVGNGIGEGDLILVEPGRPAEDNDLVVCHAGKTACAVRRLRITGETMMLLPLNTKEKPTIVEDPKDFCCFPITKIEKRLK